MRKVMILEERDYDSIVCSLNLAKDVLKSMRRTRNVGHLEYHIDNAIHKLTGEDSSIQDLRNSIPVIDY